MNKHQIKQPAKKDRPKKLATGLQVALVKAGVCDIHQLRYIKGRYR